MPKLPPRKPVVETVPAEPKSQAIDAAALATALPELAELMKQFGSRRQQARTQPRTTENTPFKLPWFPKAAKPPERQMAMDNMPVFADAGNAWLDGGGFAAEGLVFLGYPYLSELAQRPEYRTMAETIADDATREWISFDVTGDEKTERENRNKDPEGYEERLNDPDEMKKRVKGAGKEERVKKLIDDQERLEVRDRFYWASTFDSWMGRSHLYLQIGDVDFERLQGEMAASIGNSRDATSKTKVTPQTPLKYIKTVEPVWTYPMAYNAQNPLAPDWYNPQQWYVMGREINISRLMTFVTRPVPDMLKPAYAFGGLPLSQIAKPYVDIWLDTRQSVADLIKSFSTMVLETDLAVQTSPGNATALLARVLLYNMMRDNQGLFVTNKSTEGFKNVAAPLGGLHELQAQSQEHMLSVARIPAVKFTGIQPAGLNASSDGEIKVYDDTIKAYEKRSFDPNLTRVINFEMLSLFGEIDPEITHRWNPLRQLTDAEKADQKKKEADWFSVLVEMGSFSPAEIRGVVINDPESPFAGLNPDDVPPPPAQPGEEDGDDDQDEVDPEDEETGGEGPETAGGPGGAQDSDPFGATDEFEEADHPRDQGGKFTAGGGGGGSSSQKLKAPQLGITPAPSSWSYKPRPFPKSSGKPSDASSVVVFSQANESPAKSLNGKAFKSWKPPADWASVPGQAAIDEPELPELPKGMTLSSGVIVREPDGRVWMVRPSNGYGGYDQTFPKGGVEEGLSPQANAIKEAFEESGLKVKITGFAGDHEGDTSLTRFYYAERAGGDPREAGWETEGVVLAPPDKLKDFLNRRRDREIAATLNPKAPPASPGEGGAELDPKDLTKKGGALGSNEGGTFEDAQGNKFYVKRPQSKAHVANELAAARLYQLAGVNTLDYRPVKGGNHVATAWEKLDKNRISQMSDAERKAAASDFAVHAWLSNWDAAGTGGDNQGIRGGKPVTLDVGGSLRYRAQGGEKGKAFGPKVSEIDTMRDKSKSPDAARLFGKMSDDEITDSVSRVTSIPDAKIRAAAQDDGLADVLIARKQDLAKRFGLLAGDEAMMVAADEANWEEGKHPRAPDGKFTSGGGAGSKVGSAAELNDVMGELLQGQEPGDMDDAKSWWDANPELHAEFKKQYPDLASGTPFMQQGSKFPQLGAKTAEGKQSAFGGLYQTSGATAKENHELTVAKALAGGGKGGTHFRNLLKALILEAEQFDNLKSVPALKEKLGWAWGMAAKKLYEKGDSTGAAKALKKAAEFGYDSKKIAENVGFANQPAPKSLIAGTPLAETVKKAEAINKQQQAAAPSWSSLEQIKNAAAAAGKKLPEPTPEDLKKAVKNVALQMSYIPGAKPEMEGGAPMKQAQALLKEFNDKWAGKTVTPGSMLHEKVMDFKLLGAGMAGLAQVEKAKHAEIAAQAKAQQAEAAKKQAAAAAAEAKANAEKNAEVMKELGISENEAEGFHALAKMLGQSDKDLTTAFKSYAAEAKGLGYPISGFECALIKSYSNGTYQAVNKAIRSGAWSKSQHLYVAMINKALQKMPTYKSETPYSLTRNTHLSLAEQQSYLAGHVIQEQALMSTSTGNVFSGNTQFKITAVGKRGASIQKLSHYKGEKEVLFAAKTYFHVDKVTGTPGGQMTIHMTEWSDL